jgi:hypothetical protein
MSGGVGREVKELTNGRAVVLVEVFTIEVRSKRSLAAVSCDQPHSSSLEYLLDESLWVSSI